MSLLTEGGKSPHSLSTRPSASEGLAARPSVSSRFSPLFEASGRAAGGVAASELSRILEPRGIELLDRSPLPTGQKGRHSPQAQGHAYAGQRGAPAMGRGAGPPVELMPPPAFADAQLNKSRAQLGESSEMSGAQLQRMIHVCESDLHRYSDLPRLPTVVNTERSLELVERPLLVEHVVHKEVKVPREKVIEVPRERLHSRAVPYPIDRPVPFAQEVVREVSQIVDVPVYRPVECRVERPRLVENVIHRPVAVPRLVEREVTVPVEHVIERPVAIERIVERPVPRTVEVPVWQEELIEIPVEQLHTVAVPVVELRTKELTHHVQTFRPQPRAVPVRIDHPVDVLKPVPQDVDLLRKVNRYREERLLHAVRRPVVVRERSDFPQAVDQVVELPRHETHDVLRTRETTVEESVPMEVTIEREVEVLVQKDVFVPVEKVIHVPVDIIVEVPDVTETVREEEVSVPVDKVLFRQSALTEQTEEINDEELQREIDQRGNELAVERAKNGRMRNEHARLLGLVEEKRGVLLANGHHGDLGRLGRYLELASRVRNAQAEGNFLRTQTVRQLTHRKAGRDARMEALEGRLRELLGENEHLISIAKAQHASLSGGASRPFC